MGTPRTSGFVQGRPEWLGHVQCAARSVVHKTSEAPFGDWRLATGRTTHRAGHILCMASAGGKMRVAAAAAGAHSVQFISHHSSIGKCASGVPRPPRHGELAADCAPPASSPSTAASPGGSGTPTTPWCGAPVAAAAPGGSGSPGSTRSERRARKVSTHGWCSMSRVVGRSAGSLASAGVRRQGHGQGGGGVAGAPAWRWLWLLAAPHPWLPTACAAAQLPLVRRPLRSVCAHDAHTPSTQPWGLRTLDDERARALAQRRRQRLQACFDACLGVGAALVIERRAPRQQLVPAQASTGPCRAAGGGRGW